MMTQFLAVVALTALLIVASAEIDSSRVLIIGHRGAPGLLPEHTLEAYQLAIDQGADFIECDIVLTKDCELICRHEPLVSGTTNADQVFPDRVRNYTVDGVEYSGVFSVDLTLDDVAELSAVQAMDFRNQSYNNLFKVPTFEDYLNLVLDQTRTVGIIPEIKHPTFFDSLNLECMNGKSISHAVAEALDKHGFNNPYNSSAWREQPAYIQSFEVLNLQELHNISEIPLVQLLDEEIWVLPDLGVPVKDLLTEQGIMDMAEYATVFSPWKGVFAPMDKDNNYNRTAFRHDIIDMAKESGMTLSTWTMRNEPKYLSTEFEGNPQAEYQFFVDEFGWGPGDSFFTDQPGTGVQWLESQGYTMPVVEGQQDEVSANTSG